MSNLFKTNLVYRPFAYPWAIELWNKQAKAFWIIDEIPLGDDVTAWKNNKLTKQEKDFITQILRMFTQSDVNVGTMYVKDFIPRFANNEIVKLFTLFAAMEGIHQAAYSAFIDILGFPEGEYSRFLEYTEMAEKHEFMLSVDTSTISNLALSMAKGVFNEGVSLFASFVMLLNFQRRGLMIGLGKVTEFSIRDENLHVEGVSKVFQIMCEDYPEIVTNDFKRTIYDVARKVVQLEDAFIDLAYKDNTVEGLAKEDVKLYIRYITDRRLNQLGLKENFNINTNPLPWIDWIISGVQHTNFFEQKVSDYSIGGLQGDWHYSASEKFLIFTKDDCPWCVKAKDMIIAKGHEFSEIDLSDYSSRQKFYNTYELSDSERSVPQVFLGDLRIGGYTDLAEYLT